jgi:SAM-dependent methyltransferase
VTVTTPTIRSRIGALQRRSYQPQRDDRIIEAVASLVPRADAMLDVGSSEGRLARRLADAVGASIVRGVDVFVQPETVIEVEEYDGVHLPYPDASFDLVTIVDVLHHADDPLAVVGESLRVLAPGGALVVKDHLRSGRWSANVLRAMDVVGNYSISVPSPGRYLDLPGWVDLFGAAGGAIDAVRWPIHIHGLPWRSIARSEYQIAMRVRPTAGPAHQEVPTP